MNINELKKQIVDEYFSLTGDKITNDDPLITLIIFFQLKSNKALDDSQLNENLVKTLLELNSSNANLTEIKDTLQNIQLNRLQIVNEISAINKTQIYNEFKKIMAKEIKADIDKKVIDRINQIDSKQSKINIINSVMIFLLLVIVGCMAFLK